MDVLYLLIHGGTPISVCDSRSQALGEAEAIDGDLAEFSLVRLQGTFVSLNESEDD